jgi:hypothetical protein
MNRWDAATGISETIVAQGMFGRCDLALVNGTDYLVSGGPGSLALQHKRPGALVRLLDDDPLHEYHHVAVSVDGKWVAGCGQILDRPRQTDYFALEPFGSVCFVAAYNLESGRREFFSLPTVQSNTWKIRSIVFSPDGRFLVTGGGDGGHLHRVDIFERNGDGFRHANVREEPSPTVGSEVQDVAFSADSRVVGIVSKNGYGRIWSLRGPKWEATIYRKNGLNALAFSPDGRTLAVGDSSGIQLCDLESQFPLATIPFSRGVTSLQFSPDGRTLAWATALDGRVEFLRTTPIIAPTKLAPSVGN